METENKVSYYAVIPATIRYDKRLPANAKLLYGEITALCNQQGYCWATNNYFANLYDVSKNTISSWVSDLTKAGYIDVELIYKPNSKEIESRHIYLIDISTAKKEVYPIQENHDTYTQKEVYPIHENHEDNTQILNNKNNKNSKEFTQKIISNKSSKKESKAVEIITMKGMINLFSENENIKSKLLEYFTFRLKRGLKPNQLKIILDDLKTYAGNNEKLTIEKINNAIAGGYMQIVASWEKQGSVSKTKTNFDNTAGREVEAVVNMTTEQKQEFINNLAKDKMGNFLKF